MMTTEFAIKREVDLAFPQAVERTRELLDDEGFGVLSEIDVQAKMKEKLERDMPPYLILGACAPPLAWDALGAQPDIGVFLPCNVTLYEDGNGAVFVAAMDPTSVLTMVQDKTVEEVAHEVKDRLTRVVEAL